MSLNAYIDHTSGTDVTMSGSVSSMFSPAAYLSELYAAAQTLHNDGELNHIDSRRPDLAGLVLSQDNMDKQQSVLSLLIQLFIRQMSGSDATTFPDENAIKQMLATYRLTGTTPFHYPYSAVRQGLLQKDPDMAILGGSALLTEKLSPMSLLSLYENISPDLYSLLTEEITEDTVDDLITKNFGDIDINTLSDVNRLAQYYDLDSSDVDFLKGILTPGSSDVDGQMYTNGYFTTPLISKSTIAMTTIHATRVENPNQFSLMELIPISGTSYQLHLCSTETITDNSLLSIGIEGYDSALVPEESKVLKAGEMYSFDITIPDDVIQNGIQLYVKRKKPSNGAYHYSSCNYSFATNNQSSYLLKLNKIIRLYKALSLDGKDTLELIKNNADFLTVDESVLTQAGLACHYHQQYDVPLEQARVLAAGNIGQMVIDGYTSEFSRLFAMTDSEGRTFAPDGTSLDLTPGASDDTFRIASLCRACGVNSTELHTLWSLTSQDDTTPFTCTIDSLSSLYRVALLARVNGLSVTSLQRLLTVAGLSAQPGSLAADELATLVNTLKQLTDWLADMNFSADALYLVLTDQYSTTLTPDVENLLTTLKNNMAETTLSGDALLTALAPLVAAELQLDSAALAESVLQWFNQHPPAALGSVPEGSTALDIFWQKVCLPAQSDDDTAAMVAAFQRTGQFSLLVRTLGLSADELSLFVNTPDKLREGLTTLVPEAETVHQLSRFHSWLQQCGKTATEVLTSLATGSLTPTALAGMTGQNVLMMEQAAGMATENAAQLSGWPAIDAVEQVMTAASALGITPEDLQKLLALDYINPSETVTFDDWQTASHALMSALDDNQTLNVTAALDEEYATALSAWFIRVLAPESVTTRDDLYDWLLLDAQTSGSVMTTPVAAAIASLQLYVNRVLNGVESGLNYGAQTSTFFTRWNLFNKSYSTWAGGKKLAYFPENYVDPTVRIGQTSMMSDMLQTLSQSELSEDTVAGAFNTYMADFEKVANLSVICAYHDGVDFRSGLTWFIGQSPTDRNVFYWRTLDQALLTDGKYPANAWSEWVKIDTAITPYNGLIKPVVHNTRLYLVWVEEHTEASTGGNNTVTSASAYKMKWSWKLHDGTWATPQESVLSGEDVPVTESHLYCTYDEMHDNMAVALYIPAGSEEANKDIETFRMATIAADNVLSAFTPGKADSETTLLSRMYSHLDTTTEVRIARVVTRIMLDDISQSDITVETTVGWGDDKISSMRDSSINVTSVEKVNDDVEITIDASMTIKFEGYQGDGSGLKASLLKYYQANTDMSDFGNIWYMSSDDEKICILGDTTHIYVYNGYDSVQEYFAVVQDDDLVAIGKEQAELDNYIEKHSDVKVNEIIELFTFPPGIARYNIGVFKTIPFRDSTDGTVFINRSTMINNDYYEENVDYFKRMRELTLSQLNDEDNTLTTFYAYLIEANINGQYLMYATNSLISVDNDKTVVNIRAGDNVTTFSITQVQQSDGSMSVVVPELDLDNMTYNFTGLKAKLPGEYISQGKALVSVNFTANDQNGICLGYQDFSFSLEQRYFQYPVTLHHEDTGVQYLEAPPFRTRLNTLFARNLVSKASAGLDAVLSMDTQKMQEPVMGIGAYVTLTLAPYNAEIHGDSREFSLIRINALNAKDNYTLYTGELSLLNDTVVTLFVPSLIETKFWGSTYNHLDICARYQKGETENIALLSDDGKNWYLDKSWNNGTFSGLKSVTNVDITTEPMDFSGSNALYFWEMFYYVPMMVFQRMLDEQRYDDARTWLNYIWNPGGYIDNGTLAPWLWNVRPLEEDTSWNADIPDTFDPDAVAQADPMHYKAATVMKLLDMLIARGDGLFRQLTTDALGEAKMWYGQAQNILGTRDLTLSSASGWKNVALSETTGEGASPFLPEQNEQIEMYLQTLEQRLYNLRHNLSIDGQPLNLSIYSTPTDPKALQNAAVVAASGGSDLPVVDFIPQYRFPVMLQDASNMAGQLSQFGSTLLSVTERQDAEAMAELLQTQGSELARQAITVQQKTIEEIDADVLALKETQKGTQARYDSYQALYDENISDSEKQVMALNAEASTNAAIASGLHLAGAVADMLPNIFGLADGGSRWGAVLSATGMGMQIDADVSRMRSDKIAQSESYRRRRQEWAIQRDVAEHELAQITAQLNSLSVRREGAVLQKSYLETQQKHAQAQMSFLQSKFSNKALYSWIKGKLASIYYTFYDLTVSRCLMAEKAYRYDTGEDDSLFIRAGAWQGTYAGLLAGETLSLSLAQMEAAYLKQDTRSLEVTKTVSLAQYYSGLGDDAFTFREAVGQIIGAGSGSAGPDSNGLTVKDGALNVTVKLSVLGIMDDYPADLGDLRRLKQVSVTLPALLGPYDDVRAVLSYGGSSILPKGCKAVAISHGMHDSGQFQLNFEDSRYLPFEGIPVDDSGTLTLSFPDMAEGQKALLSSLNDVILHMAYTIR